MVSFTLLPIYPRGNSPRYPVYRRLDGPQNRSRGGGETHLLPLLGTEIQFPGLSAHSPSLCRLIYPGFFKKADNEIQLLVYYFCSDVEKALDNQPVELTDLQSDRRSVICNIYLWRGGGSIM
jgi:hypothetical protein